jgi:hypothetical protein
MRQLKIKLRKVASCWIYIGILLVAHPILHISRIRVKEKRPMGCSKTGWFHQELVSIRYRQTQKYEKRDRRLVVYQTAYNKTARRRRRGTKGGKKRIKLHIDDD